MAGARSRVLLCDDDGALRELMRVTLGPGYEFVEAEEAERALELARRVRPDVALIDVMLPGRSGLSLLEQIRADPALRGVSTVIVSAWQGAEDRAAAIAAGADAFLGKPFELEELSEVVASLVDGGP